MEADNNDNMLIYQSADGNIKMRPLQNSSYNLSFLNIFCTFIV